MTNTKPTFPAVNQSADTTDYEKPRYTAVSNTGRRRISFGPRWRSRMDVSPDRRSPQFSSEHELLLGPSMVAAQVLPKDLHTTRRHRTFSEEASSKTRARFRDDAWEVPGMGLFSKAEIATLFGVEESHVRLVAREHKQKQKPLPFMWEQVLWLLAHDGALVREVAYLPPAEQRVNLRQLREQVFAMTMVEFGVLLSLSGASVGSLERFDRRFLKRSDKDTIIHQHRAPLRIVLKLLVASPQRTIELLLAYARFTSKTAEHQTAIDQVAHKLANRQFL